MIRLANYMVKRLTKWALYAELHKVTPETAYDYWQYIPKKTYGFGWFNGCCDPLVLGLTRTRVGAWIQVIRYYREITKVTIVWRCRCRPWRFESS